MVLSCTPFWHPINKVRSELKSSVLSCGKITNNSISAIWFALLLYSISSNEERLFYRNRSHAIIASPSTSIKNITGICNNSSSLVRRPKLFKNQCWREVFLYLVWSLAMASTGLTVLLWHSILSNFCTRAGLSSLRSFRRESRFTNACKSFHFGHFFFEILG